MSPQEDQLVRPHFLGVLLSGIGVQQSISRRYLHPGLATTIVALEMKSNRLIVATKVFDIGM